MLWTIVKVGAGLGVLAAVVGFILVQFFGLRMELSGTGMTPLFSFHDPEAHYAAIERDRREASKILKPPPPPAAPFEAAAPADSEPEARVETPVNEAPMPEPDRTAPPDAPWPTFLGPGQDGVHRASRILTDWPEDGLREIWRQKVGGGYASMSVAEGKVFTIEQRREKEVVAAYDLETGLPLWEHGWDGHFQETMGGDGPRSTPTWSDGRLYALGAEGELRCLHSSDGSLVWRTNILEDAGADNAYFGMPASPLVHEGKVIVNPGKSDGKSVAAYDALTGELLWQSHSNLAGYASPVVRTLADKPTLLVFAGDAMLGMSPDDGAPWWEFPFRNSYDINAAQPIFVDGEHLLISASYGMGAALLQVLADGDSLSVQPAWKKNTMKMRFNPGVLFEGHVYGIDDGILACIDVRTGERKWKGGRYGYGQLLLADGHLIVLTEKGEVVLVKAAPESHQELARFTALEGKTWNVPAIAEGKLLVRNQTEMAAYQLGL